MEVITLTWLGAKNLCIFALDTWISFYDSLKTLIFAKYFAVVIAFSCHCQHFLFSFQ